MKRIFVEKKADSIVTLKDGRKLLKYDNGFTYCVMSTKGVIEEVSKDYYYNQLKRNRLTKRNKTF